MDSRLFELFGLGLGILASLRKRFRAVLDDLDCEQVNLVCSLVLYFWFLFYLNGGYIELSDWLY